MKLKENKIKELVTLRERPLKNGVSSLFLDYSIDGQRIRENLHMYLVPEKSRLDKIKNSETIQLAQAVKAKRTVALQNKEYGFRGEANKMTFAEYMEQRRKFYEERGNVEYSRTVGKIIKWLRQYNKPVRIGKLDTSYIIGMFAYLRKEGLAEGTLRQYYEVMSTACNYAVREDIISSNPFKKLDEAYRPKRVEATREFLTFDELKAMNDTPSKDEALRQMFFFSCFTGIRLGDIENLTWDKIQKVGTGWQIALSQSKTKKPVYVPLSANALEQLPKRGKGAEKVWPDILSRSQININLRAWAGEAGITKHISFHCARHTYATMMITYGADIYTVSKLLGHSDIAITQVYAKIVDKKKVDAVNLIPTL